MFVYMSVFRASVFFFGEKSVLTWLQTCIRSIALRGQKIFHLPDLEQSRRMVPPLCVSAETTLRKFQSSVSYTFCDDFQA